MDDWLQFEFRTASDSERLLLAVNELRIAQEKLLMDQLGKLVLPLRFEYWETRWIDSGLRILETPVLDLLSFGRPTLAKTATRALNL